MRHIINEFVKKSEIIRKFHDIYEYYANLWLKMESLLNPVSRQFRYDWPRVQAAIRAATGDTDINYRAIFMTLCIAYVPYSIYVYTLGTETPHISPMSAEARHGQELFQEHNCIDSLLLITEVFTTGKERDLAIKKINEHNLNVILCGFVPQEMLPKFYSIADIAIYAGIGQGASAASLFVLECMACETPVIRTNDTNEEVEHEKTGYLFEAEDTVNFQKYVLDLLSDESLREKFGKSARQFIEENYSWKKVSEIFEQNCLKLLDEKS